MAVVLIFMDDVMRFIYGMHRNMEVACQKYSCKYGIQIQGRGAPNMLSGCSVSFLLSQFYTTFLKNCGRGESVRNTTCP